MFTKYQKRIFTSSFYCGLIIFFINVLLGLSKDISAVLIMSYILPGFVFGIVLNFDNSVVPIWKRLLFIVASGSLFTLVAWLATDIHLSFRGQTTFMLSSLLGAYVLLFLYSFILGRTIIIWKGVLFATLTGIISSYFPAKVYHDNNFTTSIGAPYDIIILTSIFLTWQTFFGLTVALSSPATTNNSYKQFTK